MSSSGVKFSGCILLQWYNSVFIIPQASKVFLSSVFVYCLWQREDFPVPQAILLSRGLPEMQLHFNLLYAKALLPISSSSCWTFPLSPCSRIWVTLESLTKLLLTLEQTQSYPLCLLPSGVSSSLPFLWHPQSWFNRAPFHLTTYIVASNTVFKVGFEVFFLVFWLVFLFSFRVLGLCEYPPDHFQCLLHNNGLQNWTGPTSRGEVTLLPSPP